MVGEGEGAEERGSPLTESDKERIKARIFE